MRSGCLALALLLCGCGDAPAGEGGPGDPKPPPGALRRMKGDEPPGSWESQPTIVQERAAWASWSRTRPNDTATWEIRVKDSPLVTRLTWKALGIEDGLVRFEVSSETTDAAGRVVATATSVDERHPVGTDSPLPAGLEKPFEAGALGDKRFRQVRAAGPRADGVIIIVSDEVPFGGLVRRRDMGIDQVLVAFEKAR